MKKLFPIVLTFLLTITVHAKTFSPIHTFDPTTATPSELVSYFSARYGANEDEVRWILNNESRLTCNPKGWNDGGSAYGIAQYHKATFERYEKLFGEDLNYYSCYDQIKLFAYQFANIPSSKCEWSLYRKTYCS